MTRVCVSSTCFHDLVTYCFLAPNTVLFQGGPQFIRSSMEGHLSCFIAYTYIIKSTLPLNGFPITKLLFPLELSPCVNLKRQSFQQMCLALGPTVASSCLSLTSPCSLSTRDLKRQRLAPSEAPCPGSVRWLPTGAFGLLLCPLCSR